MFKEFFINTFIFIVFILSSSVVIFPEDVYPYENHEEQLTEKERIILDSMCPYGSVVVEYKNGTPDEFPTCINVDMNKKEWIIVNTPSFHDLINNKNMEIKTIPFDKVKVFNEDGELIFNPGDNEIIIKEY